VIADVVASRLLPEHVHYPPPEKYGNHEKIRIGYFSADLRNHPVTYLTAELFELHDKDQFEVVAFSYGTYDQLTSRVNAAVDDFVDARTLSDDDVINLARTLELDIAVDLGGYTANNRTVPFAGRVAPIQVSYLGYPGTMGNGVHDYLLADRVLIPEALEHGYAEKIARLPVYQVNDTKRAISDRVFTRAELNIPEEGFVFCCFNNPVKFNPLMFDTWSSILRRDEKSVLFLLADNDIANKNIILELNKRGVATDRIILGERLPRPEYLARYRACDLFLDTLPFNAGATASDALWAGLPVLTCTGEAFASRMAASLLTSLKLPELITTSLDEYVETAVQLASNPEKAADLRARLAHGIRAGLLFDTPSVVKHIEKAFKVMHNRHLQGLPPQTFEIFNQDVS
jgi:predicted O-linked N-acetylglucosamine transferase (SPINDLY family)